MSEERRGLSGLFGRIALSAGPRMARIFTGNNEAVNTALGIGSVVTREIANEQRHRELLDRVEAKRDGGDRIGRQNRRDDYDDGDRDLRDNNNERDDRSAKQYRFSDRNPDDIKRLKKDLKALRYYNGDVNSGKIDDGLRQAVRNFNTDHEIEGGSVTDETLKALHKDTRKDPIQESLNARRQVGTQGTREGDSIPSTNRQTVSETGQPQAYGALQAMIQQLVQLQAQLLQMQAQLAQLREYNNALERGQIVPQGNAVQTYNLVYRPGNGDKTPDQLRQFVERPGHQEQVGNLPYRNIQDNDFVPAPTISQVARSILTEKT